MRHLLHKLINHQNLTRAEARGVFDDVMSGKLSDTQIAGLLIGLSAKGLTADELAGAATVMAERAIPIATPAGANVLDIRAVLAAISRARSTSPQPPRSWRRRAE